MLSLPLAIVSAIALLLLLIIVGKFNAFLSLLVASIWVGLASGMPIADISGAIIEGMGGTLGFVATIVGLGAIFGAILERSGGAQSLAQYLLRQFGEKRAPGAMLLTGFVVAIPVFFDVAFIILIPVIYALARRSGQSLLLYAIPLLAGLAITHAFIPPTPGPVAVADILKADLGWVILFGIIVGLPTALVSGLLFGRYIAGRIFVPVPTNANEAPPESVDLRGLVPLMLAIIALPILLILGNTLSQTLIKNGTWAETYPLQVLQFLGHPIIALLLATFVALYFLGTRRGMSRTELSELSMKALAPAGAIILITGAGGVFKQMLIKTGAGEAIGAALADLEVSYVLLAFGIAALVRMAQGSATVAMITAAGIMGPLLEANPLAPAQSALLVLAIASGATILSHVNDSGFWLVNRYLQLSERDTLRAWTGLTTVIALSSLVVILLLYSLWGLT
ncbi:MAG: gluconate:H+ symporter [Bacteroidota bacterium]